MTVSHGSVGALVLYGSDSVMRQPYGNSQPNTLILLSLIPLVEEILFYINIYSGSSVEFGPSLM